MAIDTQLLKILVAMILGNIVGGYYGYQKAKKKYQNQDKDLFTNGKK